MPLHNMYYFSLYFIKYAGPRGLRGMSAAVRLLRSWVRIPSGVWMSVVSVVCCQVEVPATSWSLVQRSPTDCCVAVCDLESSWMRRPSAAMGCSAERKKKSLNMHYMERILKYKSCKSQFHTLHFKLRFISYDFQDSFSRNCQTLTAN